MRTDISVRHGFTMADIDGIARAAFMADRSAALDANTRYAAAWSAVAEALCAAERVPSRQDLVRVGWQAIYAEVRAMRHTFGRERDNPNAPVASMSGAQQYWHMPPVDVHNDRVERIAVHQVMATLGEVYRNAVVALAVHGDYQLAADSLDITYKALGFRLGVARREFRRLWFAPETAPAQKGTDRRIGSRHTKLRTHCVAGHELTGDNVYRRPNPKPGKRGERVCRQCERARSAARSQAKRKAS